MKKIPTIFLRDLANLKLVTTEPNPAGLWVFHDEGVATRKFDGSPLKLDNAVWFKRYDCKKDRTLPPRFVSADEPDAVTGHWPGWVPLTEGPEDRWFRQAIRNSLVIPDTIFPDSTYEACGPHFQGNPEHLPEDRIILHGNVLCEDAPRTFAGLADYLRTHDIEGIVWHHPDGRMAKIKGRDFGIKRQAAA